MQGVTTVFGITLVALITNGLEAKTCNTYLSTLSNKSVFKYGEVIQFRCIVYNVSTIDISELSLINKQTNMSVSFRNITGNTSYAEIEVHNSNFTGQYSCRYDNCSKDTLLSVIHISIDPCSIPGQYEVKPNISCIVNDLSTMACFWSTVKTSDDCGSWHIMYTSTLMEHYYCCANHVVATSVDACAQSGPLCVIPVDDLFICFTYTFVMSRVTSQGQEFYNYTMLAGNDIVKIGIDDDVNVYPGASPRDLHMTFTVHHSPASVQGLLCSLTCISQWGDYKTFVQDVQDISLDITVTLQDLNPYTVYTVNITCKPTTSPYWSNHVTGSGITQSMVPDSIPNLIGYSVVMTSLNLTKIYLYLKTVPMYEWYDKELRYVVTMDDGNVHVVDKYDSNTITAILTHQVATNQTYLVQVQSENNVGESKMVKFFNLTANQKGTYVTLENTAMGGIVTLFPDDGNNITGLTYFRCHGHPDLFPPVCQTELENQTVSRFIHTFLWQQERTDDFTYSWYYGVRIHRQGVDFDKRILWSDCVFQENSETRDTTLDVSAVYDNTNSSVAIVMLHFNYCDLRHKPLHYLVGVWNSGTNVTDYCAQQQSEFQSFTATPFINKLNVSLYQLTKPCLCVRVQYEDDYDFSVDKIPQYSALQDSQIATSVKTVNTVVQVVAAVIGSILACFVVVLILLKIRKFRFQLRKNNRIPRRVMMNILENAPEIKEENHQYTIVVEEANSSGYESLQVNSSTSEPTQSNSSGPMFEDIANVDLYESSNDTSTCDTSNFGPAVIYSPICHGEEIITSGNVMVDKRTDISLRINTDYDDSGETISSEDEASIINYTQLQIGEVNEVDNCRVYGETPHNGSTTNGEVIKTFSEGSKTDGNTEVLNHIQVSNEHAVETGICECAEDTCRNVSCPNFRLGIHANHVDINDNKDKIEINVNVPTLNYSQVLCTVDEEIVDNEDVAENSTALNYIRVSHESEEESDLERETNEEQRGLDDENTLEIDTDKEHNGNITLDTDDDVSLSKSEIVNSIATPRTSDSDTSLSDDVDTDNDYDDGMIDSYSQLAASNGIPGDYALGHIINSSN